MFRMLALLSSLAAGAAAQEDTGGLFGFFDGRDIDFWAEGRRVPGPEAPATTGSKAATQTAAPPFSGSSVVRARDAQPFSWNSYQDPRLPEFWDDGGDWIPPRPFREAAASPTPQNIREYLGWQARKTAVVSRFQAALTEGAAAASRSPSSTPRQQTPSAASVAAQIPWRDLKIAYFYQTSCPHCRASKDTVEEARRLGAQVIFVQLDHATSPPLHTPSVPYDQEWEQTFHVASTPTWVLSLNGKTVKHTGALGMTDLNQVTSTLLP